MVKTSPALEVSFTARIRVDRRRNPRYPTNDAARVTLLEAPFVALPGAVVNVSRSGVGLEVPVAIHKGAQLLIQLDRAVIIGEARHCKSSGAEYLVGVQVRSVLPNEERPERHLGDEELQLYVCGEGLAVPQILELRRHLSKCKPCLGRLRETSRLVRRANREESPGATVDNDAEQGSKSDDCPSG